MDMSGNVMTITCIHIGMYMHKLVHTYTYINV